MVWWCKSKFSLSPLPAQAKGRALDWQLGKTLGGQEMAGGDLDNNVNKASAHSAQLGLKLGRCLALINLDIQKNYDKLRLINAR